MTDAPTAASLVPLFLVLAYDRCNGSVRGWTGEASYESAQTYLRRVAAEHPHMVFWIQKAEVKDWRKP